MTLTSILPSMRRLVPDPIVARHWPANTVAGLDDVVIAAVSLHRLAEVCGTPCVHTAAAVEPGTGGRASHEETVSVVVARVTRVDDRSGNRLVQLDADLANVEALPMDTRLIARISTAHETPALLGAPDRPTLLPADLVVGDLLAIPCRDAASLHDVRPNLGEPYGRCGR
ncbi:hypothetical protein [Agromyces aureus]|uniref:Uncharacterized protein n=1 Tax=Agromyces aureus TaxID=453304 RepID=A0A191WBY4_9MICO|nr:hypothetical protein [Agromyces aureus]ANJ25747.1 hypothetical protein ATC03_02170 [Agromyces aureus]